MKNKISTSKKLKFWMLYNAVVFVVYFILSTVALRLFSNGEASWSLAIGMVLTWVAVFSASFAVTYILRRYLGIFIFAVAALIATVFVIHFIHMKEMRVSSPEAGAMVIFAYYLIPTYVVAFVHAVGQGICGLFLNKIFAVED